MYSDLCIANTYLGGACVFFSSLRDLLALPAFNPTLTIPLAHYSTQQVTSGLCTTDSSSCELSFTLPVDRCHRPSDTVWRSDDSTTNFVDYGFEYAPSDRNGWGTGEITWTMGGEKMWRVRLRFFAGLAVQVMCSHRSVFVLGRSRTRLWPPMRLLASRTVL
jgi:hypothetical protein